MGASKAKTKNITFLREMYPLVSQWCIKKCQKCSSQKVRVGWTTYASQCRGLAKHRPRHVIKHGGSSCANRFYLTSRSIRTTCLFMPFHRNMYSIIGILSLYSLNKRIEETSWNQVFKKCRTESSSKAEASSLFLIALLFPDSSSPILIQNQCQLHRIPAFTYSNGA